MSIERLCNSILDHTIKLWSFKAIGDSNPIGHAKMSTWLQFLGEKKILLDGRALLMDTVGCFFAKLA